MKKCIIFLIMLLVLPSIFAVDLKVEQTNSDIVIIEGLTDPAIFNMKITNNGSTDNFKFYNLYGFMMTPVEYFEIKQGETKEMNVEVYPLPNLEYLGYYSLTYGLRSRTDDTEYPGSFNFKIVDMKNAMEVGAEAISPESQTITIYLKNKENFNFGETKAEFSSPFFEKEETFALGPKEKKSIEIQLNKEDFKQLIAGDYPLTARVEAKEKKVTVEGIINFVEKDIVTSVEKDEGFFINTKVIRKSNQGNVVATTQSVIKKNIISRLFTTISPQPDVIQRKGFEVYYTWNRELKPGENLDIEIKTNWFFPLIAVLFVLAIVGLAMFYTNTYVVVRKKVSFVNAKGGEFALRVDIFVKAKDYVEKVNVIDRLPALTKIYEKFSGDRPLKVNPQSGRIEWMFERLNKGETRMMSYIIYSKVGVLGRFALPSAAVIYERNGQVKESESNKAFFMAEQTGSHRE